MCNSQLNAASYQDVIDCRAKSHVRGHKHLTTKQPGPLLSFLELRSQLNPNFNHDETSDIPIVGGGRI